MTFFNTFLPKRHRIPVVTTGRPLPVDVTVRMARTEDSRALARLAALDDAPLVTGRVLVAEVDDELWAAVTLDSSQGHTGGRAIADPFRRTAELVDLLQARAAQLVARAQQVARDESLPRTYRASGPEPIFFSSAA